MARKIIQDVVPVKRKKPEVSAPVRIPINISKADEASNERRAPERKGRLASVLPNESKNKKYNTPFPKLPKRKGERFWEKQQFWWSLGGAVVIVGGIFIASAYFLKVNIEIVPGKATAPVSLSLGAKKSSPTGVPFEIIVTKGTESKSVTATGSKNVSIKASGKIIVYNNYSSATQKLVGSTRFATPNGKIYRIQNDIIVPGKNGDTPGQIEVVVYADKAGADYNAGLSDFTIPGFKGDPRYDKFYGRSKTEITGGFSGVAPVAGDKDIAEARASIEKSLKDDLLRDASSQVPDGYILYKDATQISFEDSRDTGNESKAVTLAENGTLVGLLLKRTSISDEVSKKITDGGQISSAFTLDSIDSLTFSFASNTPMIDAKTKEVSFALNGAAGITYSVDIPALKNDLAGKAKTDFSSILSKYSSIKEARIVSFQPFWSGYFPSKPDKIGITIAK